MPNPSHRPQIGRWFQHSAQRSFWLLVLVAVVATRALGNALGDSPSPSTGLRVAASGLVLLVSLTLATRVMIALERARRRDNQHSQNSHDST